MSDSNGTRNLYQRLAAIAGEVAPIKATGKTAQGQPALSIVDVEDALRSLFIKHGIVSGYHWNSLPIPIERTGRSGNYTEWQADLTLWLMNPDDPKDTREDRVCDIGSSPSAAVSFALKRYWRALFHLADESDESPSIKPAIAPVVKSAFPPDPPLPRSVTQSPQDKSVRGLCVDMIGRMGIKAPTVDLLWKRLGVDSGGLGATENDWQRMAVTLEFMSTGTEMSRATVKAFERFPKKEPVKP
jgi:hypothetical protein